MAKNTIQIKEMAGIIEITSYYGRHVYTTEELGDLITRLLQYEQELAERRGL